MHSTKDLPITMQPYHPTKHILVTGWQCLLALGLHRKSQEDTSVGIRDNNDRDFCARRYILGVSLAVVAISWLERTAIYGNNRAINRDEDIKIGQFRQGGV